MTGDLGIYIVFALGILVGGLLFNKDFRQKFFKEFRKFLGQVGRGTRDPNAQYEKKSYRVKRDESGRIIEVKEKPEVQHVYKEVHQRIICPVCQGSGRVYEKMGKLQEGAPGFKPRTITCPECEGEGKVWD